MHRREIRLGRLVLNYNAPFSLTFALISLVVLIIDLITSGRSTDLLFCTYRFELSDILGYFRLFTYVLGHLNIQHYISNITLLLVLGPALEERYGTKLMILMTLITALFTSLFNCAFFPHTAILGASGIVYMMILLSSIGRVRGEGIPLTLIFVFIIYIGGEIYDGIFLSDNISQLSHIIGGICGAVFGLLLSRGRRRMHAPMPPHFH